MSHFSKIVLLLALVLTLVSCVANPTHDYVFDFVDGNGQERAARVMDRFPLAGQCSFRLGPREGDSFIVVSVESDAKFIRVHGGGWELSIPKGFELGSEWVDGQNRYRYLGDSTLHIGDKEVSTMRVHSVGQRFGDWEFFVNEQYGLLGYGSLDQTGRFVASTLVSPSVLDCSISE
jgi:hypothetical protein